MDTTLANAITEGHHAPLMTGPLIVVKRSEQEFHDFVATPRGFMSIFGSYAEERLRFENYQCAFMDTQRRYRCIEKSRQTGFSFVFAAEAVARNHLSDKQTSIFVSYNLDDAKEKITYSRQLYEDLPLEYQKKLVNDSKTELGFQSNGSSRRISRILSNPSKAPRGKNGDIYLDELAHYRNDREVYKGSTALILRSGGQLTVCSSPLGRRGLFWEIARQEIRKYPGYWRQKVPWWLCSFFCNDVPRASKEAPFMSTEERVKKFGSQGIKDQFEAMMLEDFQEEFEVIYQDETESFFSYTLILDNTDDELELFDEASQLNKCTGRLVAGYDVGRKRDRAELIVLEESNSGKKTARYAETHVKVPFQDQEESLRALLRTTRIARLSIDGTGIGAQLAENLHMEFPDIVVAEDFTMQLKATLATDVKIAFQGHMLSIPADKSLVRQIHAIKKRVTPHGNVVFEVEASGDKAVGHGDKFWALALANQKERKVEMRPATISVRTIG